MLAVFTWLSSCTYQDLTVKKKEAPKRPARMCLAHSSGWWFFPSWLVFSERLWAVATTTSLSPAVLRVESFLSPKRCCLKYQLQQGTKWRVWKEESKSGFSVKNLIGTSICSLTSFLSLMAEEARNLATFRMISLALPVLLTCLLLQIKHRVRGERACWRVQNLASPPKTNEGS